MMKKMIHNIMNYQKVKKMDIKIYYISIDNDKMEIPV